MLEIQSDFEKAIYEYRRISETADSDSIRITADIALARCLNKLNRADEAISQLRVLLSEYSNEDLYVRIQK